MSNAILLVGCGDIGMPLGELLVAKGNRVWGLRRNISQLPASISPLSADVTRSETLQVLEGIDWDYVVVSLTPASFTDESYNSIFVEGLRNLIESLQSARSLKRLIFVSSTSVYHQAGDEWVDEQSPTNPSSFSGKRLLQAEQLLADSGLPFSIVRFAGIYGPGRRRLIQQVLDHQGCEREPSIYTNRIHSRDCVGFLGHLIERDQQAQPLDLLYIGVDNEPVTLWDVKQWMARKLGVDPNGMMAMEQTRRGSKRCSNQRMLATGYQLKYAGYQQGYSELILGES